MAWLDGWTYRKAIVIAHTDDGAQTNYQVKLLIGESSGATGEDFDLESLVASDFDDLRITTSDGTTLCDYWIESITGASPNGLATVWVEIPSIAAHPDDTTIYVYYGNAGAVAASSGADTFIEFDNFEWGNDGDSLSTSGGSITWTVTTAGTSVAAIDDAQHYGGTRSALFYRDGTNTPTATFSKTAGADYAIRWRTRKENVAGQILRHGNGTRYLYLAIRPTESIDYFTGGAFVATGSSVAVDTWELMEINAIDWTNYQFDIWFNGARIKENADMQVGSDLNQSIGIANATATSSSWIDDILVRKWTVNEPAYSSAGSAESNRELNIKLTPKDYRRLAMSALDYRTVKLTAKDYRRIVMTEK